MSVRRWPLVSEEEVLQTPVFIVRRDTFLSPLDDREKPFTVLKVRDWVQVLAVTEDNQALLVRQFRVGTRQESLELPGGVVEIGQSPLEAAQRELREETGYTGGTWRELAAFRPNPAIQNNTAHLFLAEGVRLTGPTDFDENEDLELLTVPLEALKDLVLEGTLDHIVMVAGILYYFAGRDALPSARSR